MSVLHPFRRASVVVASLSLASLGFACSSSGGSGSGSATATAGDASVVQPGTDGAAPEASTADAATADVVVPNAKGLTISNATVTSLDGTYDIQIARADVAGGFAFNGNFDGKIEMEIRTDTSGAVQVAHVWSYTGTPMNSMPDKFYGCDGKATACTGVAVDLAAKTITLSGPTWPEVQPPSFDGTTPDALVAGGGKVTVSGTIQTL